MTEIQNQLGDLQLNLNWLKRCVEEVGVVVGLGLGVGLFKGEGHLGASRTTTGSLRGQARGHNPLALMGGLVKARSPWFQWVPIGFKKTNPNGSIWRKHNPLASGTVDGGRWQPPAPAKARGPRRRLWSH